MSQPVSATRMELLKLKQRKKLAQKGHNLLKKKRDSLIKTFFALIGNYKKLKEETIKKLAQAYEVLHVAQAVSGVHRVKSISLALQKSFEITFSSKNLMGVQVPAIDVISKKVDSNVSTIGTSYYVKDVQEKFQKIIIDIVKLAEIENVIYKLAEEIVKTKRRVNALEFIKIPELEETEKNVKSQLMELEREAFTRLKNVKKKLEA